NSNHECDFSAIWQICPGFREHGPRRPVVLLFRLDDRSPSLGKGVPKFYKDLFWRYAFAQFTPLGLLIRGDDRAAAGLVEFKVSDRQNSHSGRESREILLVIRGGIRQSFQDLLRCQRSKLANHRDRWFLGEFSDTNAVRDGGIKRTASLAHVVGRRSR